MQHKVGDDDVRFATDLPLRRVCFSTEVGPTQPFSPRSRPARTNCMPKVALQVPALPSTRWRRPRMKPPPRISSNPFSPDEALSLPFKVLTPLWSGRGRRRHDPTLAPGRLNLPWRSSKSGSGDRPVCRRQVPGGLEKMLSTTGDRGFESISLQQGVGSEPCGTWGSRSLILLQRRASCDLTSVAG